MSDDLKPIANPTVVLREEFDDWAILFDPDTGNAFGLNPTSVFIWKLLDGRHTIRDIINEVQKNFEEVPDDVEVHVNEFINDLIERGYAGYEWKQEG
jgi:SynChlorMet cassette protein ScmD